MKETIKNELLEIIRPYVPDDYKGEFNEDAHLINDLNINSAHVVDIVLDIEDHYDIILDDDSINQIRLISDSINLVMKHVA